MNASARLFLLVATPFVTALALATALGLVIEPLRPGSALHVHWLGSGVLSSLLAAVFASSVLLRAPLARRFGRGARLATAAIAGLAALGAAASAWRLAAGVADGSIVERGAAPSASLLATVLLATWAAVEAFEARSPRVAWPRVAHLLAFSAASALLLLGWIEAAGTVDHGAGTGPCADAIVVFGSKVNADGTPSGSLRDRTLTACEVWRRGRAPLLVLSGGRAPGVRTSEPEAMRAVALAEGVPAAAILLDECGNTTAATVANVAALARERGFHRVLAVSHDYHLARIRLLFDRAGLAVATVPAKETCGAGWKVTATAREVVAWAAAWAF